MNENNKKNLSSRFDYVQYDDKGMNDQATLKQGFIGLETTINALLPDSRARSLIFTKLEEAYMWVGKAIRDEQYSRTGTSNLNERRQAS